MVDFFFLNCSKCSNVVNVNSKIELDFSKIRTYPSIFYFFLILLFFLCVFIILNIDMKSV